MKNVDLMSIANREILSFLTQSNYIPLFYISYYRDCKGEKHIDIMSDPKNSLLELFGDPWFKK